jgi:hypothetical protein
VPAARDAKDDLLARGGELGRRNVVVLGVPAGRRDARVRAANERRRVHAVYVRIDTY